jgi:hypothetical protein
VERIADREDSQHSYLPGTPFLVGLDEKHLIDAVMEPTAEADRQDDIFRATG